ncbi:MAG: hypothetical protein E7313_00090 [Clostridiales bacterium]|nr:hypothetical protein [Clostridiales bacterium]
MIDKVLITEKLENFFKKTNPESFFKVFVISFLFDKINYIEKIVGNENALNMLDKYIYNLMQNIKTFKKLDKYHSIYARYDFKSKCLKYYMTNDYKNFKSTTLSNDDKKAFIIKEFKIMMYKEFEKIINIYSLNGKIISNGFYIEDRNGRYPDYEGDFSDIADIFSDVEVCNIIDINNKIKTYVDEDKKYFVYSNHISQRNSEVISYVTLWRKFLDNKLYYFAVNNPKKYSEKLINDFNKEYEYILTNNKYKFLLKNDTIFSLIENYLLHIRNRINIENNIQYHQDLSVLFKMINHKKHLSKFSEYLLHNSDSSNKLNYEEI